MTVEKEASKNDEKCAKAVTRTLPSFMIASEALSILIFLAGCAVLLGWALDIPALKSVLPNLVTMKANTALAFALSGASLWLLQVKRQESRLFRKIAGICGVAVFGIGLLTVLEYTAGWDLGIDQLLFKELPGAVLTPNLGRMAFNTASNFTLIGLALLFLASRIKRRCFFAQGLVIPEGIISLLSVIGYLYHADPLFLGPHFSTAMALHTAILFLLVFLATLFCQPGCALMTLVSSDAIGGRLIRFLFPVTILIPPFLGWLKLRWLRSGMISDEFGVSFIATANLVIISAYIYLLSAFLNKADIERARVAKALRESELSYRRLFEASKDGILIVDFDTGTIVDVNPFLINLLGYSKTEFLEKRLWDVGAFRNIVASKEAFLKLQAEGYVRFEDQPLEARSGERIEVEFVSNVYLVDHRKVVQCNIRDISVRKKAETEMRSAMDLKAEFVTMVSHEVRNPLSAIKESLTLLEAGSSGNISQEQKSFLDIAKRNTDRLSRLVNDVLDFQKIRSGKMVLDVPENDMNEVALEAGKAMRLLAEKKGLELTVDLDHDLPRMKFDRDRIMQVFINLLGNAVKFTEKGGILLKTRRENNAAHITVQDAGPGIKSEDLPNIFLAFEQLKGTKKGGTGLGLAISKEIILLHHGKIWAESEAGKGATLHFILPIQERRR